MATEQKLPTWPEIERNALADLDKARTALSDARDWLHSDWRPPNLPLTSRQAAAKNHALQMIAEAKIAIDDAKNKFHAG